MLVLAVVLLGGSADPAWTESAVASSLSSGGPLSQALQEILSQGVSWILLAVIALVAIPWSIAAIALAASFLKPRKLT